MPVTKIKLPAGRAGLVLAWLLFLSILAVYWQQLLASHDKQLASAEQATLLRADQAAHALAMQAHSMLLKIEFFLDHLVEHWVDHDPEVFHKLIELGQKGIFKGSLKLILVTDARGEILFNSLGETDEQPGRTLVVDREYFQQHTGQQATFVIGQPERNRVTGEWTVQLSHAISENGEFAGVLVASVSPEHLAEAFTRIYPEKPNVVMLILDDGRYLTRSQELELHLGKSVPAGREFIRHPELNSGRYTTTAPIDGIARYYAWHRVPDYPVVLSLGLNQQQALERTLGNIKRSTLQNLFTSLALFAAALWITFHSRVRARQHQLLLQAQERVMILLERFPSGVLLEDEQDRVVAVNPRLCSLLAITGSPSSLYGLSHKEFTRRLDDDYAGHLLLPEGEQAASQRTELQEASGRTLEIEWLPIRHGQRNLGHAWFVKDISARKQKEHELATLASVDPLTGLLNRRSFMELLGNSLRNSQPHLPGALLILDIDHFKAVNDTYGHPAGDLVLQNVAGIIRSNLRKGDYTGRLGGEEFAVLLPDATSDDALLLAERIRKQLEGEVTETPQGTIAVTISAGISLLYGESLQTAPEKADKALYQAKNSDRNRVCFYQTS